MSTVLKTKLPPKDPENDRWRYGERYSQRVGPNGDVIYDRVPLKQEDLLFPQEGDRPVITEGDRDDVFYLLAILQSQAAGHRDRHVFSDHRIDFEAAGIEPLGPDLIVFDGVEDWDRSRGTFPVVTMAAAPVLAIEITSPDTRRFDLRVKPDLYYRCGVPCYAIVDRQSGGGSQVRVLGFQAAGRRYVAIPADKRGRVWLEPVGLALGVANDRATCYDKRGRRIPSPQEQAEKKAAAKGRALAQSEREKAEMQQRIAALEAQLGRLGGTD